MNGKRKDGHVATLYGCRFLQFVAITGVFLAILMPLRGGIYGTVTLTNVTVYGMGGDLAWSSPQFGIPCRLSNMVVDNKIQCLLDIRAAKTLEAIVIVNVTNAATLMNANKAIILVAPDEHAAEFNYADETCYTIQVFSNAVTPSSYLAGVWRTAVLEQRLKRRYFLIQHTHNFWGAVDTPNKPDTREVRLHDIIYHLAPPIGTVVQVR